MNHIFICSLSLVQLRYFNLNFILEVEYGRVQRWGAAFTEVQHRNCVLCLAGRKIIIPERWKESF